MKQQEVIKKLLKSHPRSMDDIHRKDFMKKNRAFIVSLAYLAWVFLALVPRSAFANSVTESLPSGLKANLMIKLPKNTGNLSEGYELAEQSNVAVTLRLLSPNACVLVSETQTRNIVKGSLNVVLGANPLTSESFQSFGNIAGSNKLEKFQQAFSNVAAVTGLTTCYQSLTQFTLHESHNSYTPGPQDTRYLMVELTVTNKASQVIPIKLATSLGVTPYSHLASKARVAESLAQPISNAQLSEEEFSVTKIPSLDASKIVTGVLGLDRIPALTGAKIPFLDASHVTTGSFSVDRLPSPLNGSGCSDGKILKRQGGAWVCGDESGIGTESDPTVQGFAKQAPGVGLTVVDNQLRVQVGSTAGTLASGDDPRFALAFPSNTSLGGDLSGVLPNPQVDKIKGQAMTAAGNLEGQVWRYQGNQTWSPQFLTMIDLRSSVTGTASLPSSCTAHQTLVYNSVGDHLSCQDIHNLNADKITAGVFSADRIPSLDAGKLGSGVVSSDRLPVASSGVSGVVNTLAQSFAGLKTFLNGLVVSGGVSADSVSATGNVVAGGSVTATGNMTASGSVTAASVSANSLNATGAVTAERIQLSNSTATCNSSNEGSMRYNTSTKKFEGCNGTSWANISQGTMANISIGAPSSNLVKSGPVTFEVTYGSGTDTATINLVAGVITINGANTGCQVTGITGTGYNRVITIHNCTGTGSVSLSLAAGTAQSTTGDEALSAGPSPSYQVDNTGPTAPTSVTLGSVPQNLTDSPTVTFSGSSDVGGSTVASHQVRIERVSDSSQIRDWATHTSGQAVTGLSLATNTQYRILVRALDALGNIGTPHSGVTWTSINDPCLAANPALGTLCTDGSYYIGQIAGSKYFTTPGNCGEVPSPNRSGTCPGSNCYPTADFTATCPGGTDALTKTWNDGTSNWFDIGGIVNYTSTGGTGYWSSNTDANTGLYNTAQIVAITSSSQGGFHAAGRYCDRMVFGGQSDWYLPNRFELDLLRQLGSSLQSTLGVNTGGDWYWSSSEYSSDYAWVQRFSDGYQRQTFNDKNTSYRLRCMRKTP
jgi:hypothetical protein